MEGLEQAVKVDQVIILVKGKHFILEEVDFGLDWGPIESLSPQLLQGCLEWEVVGGLLDCEKIGIEIDQNFKKINFDTDTVENQFESLAQ